MKLLIILSVIAYGYGDKLDRTYLPPPSAGSAGGSPGAITAPGISGQQALGQQPFGKQSLGQGPVQGASPSSQDSYNNGANRPFGSPGAEKPSPVYGPAGRGQGSSNGFSQPISESNSQGVNANGGFNSGFGPSGSIPSSIDGQSAPVAGSYNQQQQTTGFPQQGSFSQGSNGQAPSNFASQSYQPQRAQADADRNAEILRYTNENDGERFSYSFETSNGISAEESGVATNGVQAQGGFSYTGDDGKAYTITYTADENGYQPQGEHLPTPHPIPEEILRSIEKNAQAAAAGTQEGAYRPEEYENENIVQDSGLIPFSAQQGQSQGQRPSQLYGSPSAQGPQPTQSQNYQQGSQSSRPNAQSGDYNKSSLNQAGSQPNLASGNQGPTGPQNFRFGNVQNQDASGYQYSQPQNNQYTLGSFNQGPSRLQSNNIQPSTGNGFSSPNGIPTGSNSNGFISSSGSFGSNRTPQEQSNINGQNKAFAGRGPQSSSNQYQTGSSQGYNYQSPSNSPNGQFQPGQNFNRPNSGNQGQYQSTRPTNSGSPNFGQNVAPSAQYQPSRPQGPLTGFNGQGSQSRPFGNQAQPSGNEKPQFQLGQNQGAGSGPTQPIQAPYEYNRPNQSFSPQGQAQGQAPVSQNTYNKPVSGGSNQSEQFGGPRQPPSFNTQDGYTY